MIITGSIITAIVVLLVISLILFYNGMVRGRNMVEEAWSGISVQLKRRHDLIPNLVEVARGYMQHEASTLEAVARARSQAVQASEALRGHTGQAQALGALAAAEQALGSSLGRLMVVAEAYPELKAHNAIADAMQQNDYLQREITAARTVYNSRVTQWNTDIFSWPTKMIVAARQGYTTRIPFTASAQTREMARSKFF